MKRVALLALLSAMTFVNGTCFAADDDQVKFTDVVVTQFAQRGASTLHGTTSDNFRNATDLACAKAVDARPVAPIFAAIGGVIVDWLFTRTASGISARLKKRIEAHSAGYSNEPIFQNIFDSEWNNVNETCVVMQRIECEVSAESVKSGDATCDKKGEVGLSVGIKLRNEGQFIRVLPYAMHLQKLKPEHNKGQATVAATVRLEAAGMSDDNAGFLWKSEEIPLATLACDVSKDKVSSASCAQSYGLAPENWERSQIIPLPPKITQAIVFNVGEVGQPSQGLKGFSEFLDASQGSLSAALSEAFQKKIKLKE